MSFPSSTAQVDRAARTWIWRVAEEGAYGNGTGTYEDCRFLDNDEPESSQEEAENMGQSEYLADYFNPVLGLRSWKHKARFHPAPATSQYLAAATPANDFQSLLFKAAFGGQQRGAGSTVEASPAPTTTAFTVATGHGSRFAAGQVILVQTSAGLEPTVVASIATDAITVAWALSAAPAAGNVVVNTTTNFFSQSAPTSLALRGVHATDTNYQWQLNGAIVNELTWKIDRSGLLECTVGLEGSVHNGPDALSLSTTAATDECIAPIHTRGAYLYLFEAASPNRTALPFHAIEIKHTLGNQLVNQIGGSTEGVTGTAKAGERMIVEASITTRSDRWPHYLQQSRPDMTMVLHMPNGLTGTSARSCTLILTGAVGVSVPQTAEEEKLRKTKFTLKGKRNALIAGGSTDLLRSPILWARG